MFNISAYEVQSLNNVTQLFLNCPDSVCIVFGKRTVCKQWDNACKHLPFWCVPHGITGLILVCVVRLNKYRVKEMRSGG